MDRKDGAAATVDEYIAGFPEEVGSILRKIRKIIREEAPDATERISYGMPAYELEGPLVYFAAFKNHIGFYPTPDGMTAFDAELSGYRSGKGSARFPLAVEMPWELVRTMTRYRLERNLAKAAEAKAAKDAKGKKAPGSRK